MWIQCKEKRALSNAQQLLYFGVAVAFLWCCSHQHRPVGIVIPCGVQRQTWWVGEPCCRACDTCDRRSPQRWQDSCWVSHSFWPASWMSRPWAPPILQQLVTTASLRPSQPCWTLNMPPCASRTSTGEQRLFASTPSSRSCHLANRCKACGDAANRMHGFSGAKDAVASRLGGIYSKPSSFQHSLLCPRVTLSLLRCGWRGRRGADCRTSAPQGGGAAAGRGPSRRGPAAVLRGAAGLPACARAATRCCAGARAPPAWDSACRRVLWRTATIDAVLLGSKFGTA